MQNLQKMSPHQVLIIGGGFGGLYAAKALKDASVQVTLIDKRNFHLFQPLLYQVAMSGLSPGNIAAPLRAILKRQPNVQVLMGEVVDIDIPTQQVILKEGEAIAYDTLIVAAGATHSYFGNEQWATDAPGLKSIENALDIRRRVLYAFEMAERESDPAKRRAWLTFVIVGAGPTGVELAGALAEMANFTMKDDFRQMNPAEATVFLVEGGERVLPPYAPELSQKAQQSLEKLGVTVRTRTLVTDISPEKVLLKSGEQVEEILCHTTLWAAGVQASPLGKILAHKTGALLDRVGRVMVEPDLSLPNHENLFVIGDLAHYAHRSDTDKARVAKPLPGIAPVAMQQGRYMATLIQARLQNEPTHPFRYTHRGDMATIGRAAAVAQFKSLRFGGPFAWLAWLFIHLLYLAGFDNRILVFFQWIWNYMTYKRGVRLIVGNGEQSISSN